jgi:endonuclease I
MTPDDWRVPRISNFFCVERSIGGGQAVEENTSKLQQYTMKYSIASLVSLAALADAQSSYSGCGVSQYYSGLNQNADRDSLRLFLGDLLHTTHRGVLNNTNVDDPGVGDTWAALIDLDQGSFPGKVKLLYSLEEVDAVPFGGSRGWAKERMFPISRGVGLVGPDVTDLHNMRPISYLSDIVREDKYFGECGVLTKADTCVEPAEGGAEGTCTCNRIYTPPPEVRGDIARALMYMDVRYDGRDDFTINLRLTDCPFQHERDMAYLSQMLTWHKEDPVDVAERARNDKLCGSWQGNRNPFVDFPELADTLWEAPLPLPAIGARQIYEACEKIPTQPPTTDPNQCERLNAGDIYIWLINSLDPDVIGLFSFEDMEAGFKLYMTTNPWNGEDFVDQGGTISVSHF